MKFCLIFVCFLITFITAHDVDSLLKTALNFQDTIEVKGFASLSTKPDTISLTFQINTLHETSASEALSENNEILKKALSSLRDSNLTDVEVATSDFSINPSYKYQYYNNGSSNVLFEGYKVMNTLQIKTKKSEEAGLLIDQAIKAGVKEVSSINFDFSPELEKEIKEKLLVEAVKDAHHRAELALSALKARIHEVIQVDLDNTEGIRPISRKFQPVAFANDALAEKTSIYVKSADLKVEVTVKFSIKQGAEVASLFP